MSINVEKLPGEPIVIATIEGEISVEEIRKLIVQSVNLTDKVPGLIYRITDLTYGEQHLTRILESLRMNGHDYDQWPQGFRFLAVFVGSPQLEKRLAALLYEQDETVPVFSSLDDALAFIRSRRTDPSLI
jgi:hypothetical protein